MTQADFNNTPSVDEAMLLELKEVMEDDFNLLLETFLNDAHKRLKLLNEAVLQEAADIVREQAHSFKGSASNIGARQLGSICQTLESMGRENQLDRSQEIYQAITEEFERVSAELKKYL